MSPTQTNLAHESATADQSGKHEPTVRANGMRTAAFFDMDHTVLQLDTGVSWMQFLRRRRELSLYGLGETLMWSLQYKLAILDIEALASKLATRIEGDSEQALIRKHRIWFEAIARRAIAPKARTAMAEHQRRGDMIVLCTGATQFPANDLADALDIEHVLSTRLEVVDGLFTGKVASFCFGKHKLTRTEEWAQANNVDLDCSWFYSDSFNDLPLMNRVGTAIAINPDARLKRYAARRGWKIDRWR